MSDCWSPNLDIGKGNTPSEEQFWCVQHKRVQAQLFIKLIKTKKVNVQVLLLHM